MSSREKIATMALLNLGENGIQDFNETTNQAAIIREYYDPFIRHIFSIYAWSFATKKVSLNKITAKPVNEYSTNFVRPDEALHIFKLFDGANPDDNPISDFSLLEDLVLTNYNSLVAQYSVYKNEALWPGYFVTFSSWALSSMIAMPVTDSADRAADAHEKAYGTPREGGKGGFFAIALGADARQSPPQTRRPSPLSYAFRARNNMTSW